MVQAEPDDGLHMLQGDGVLALVGSQGAGGLIGGDVAADAVHIQQAADLANLPSSHGPSAHAGSPAGLQQEPWWQHVNTAI